VKTYTIRCPECNTIFNYYESEFRPFCSNKCKSVDLNMWFDEEYKVPSQTLYDPLEHMEDSHEQ
jgi:endogenous inhibitor of DNA gyrase (YacG/DUF329 family)